MVDSPRSGHDGPPPQAELPATVYHPNFNGSAFPATALPGPTGNEATFVSVIPLLVALTPALVIPIPQFGRGICFSFGSRLPLSTFPRLDALESGLLNLESS